MLWSERAAHSCALASSTTGLRAEAAGSDMGGTLTGSSGRLRIEGCPWPLHYACTGPPMAKPFLGNALSARVAARGRASRSGLVTACNSTAASARAQQPGGPVAGAPGNGPTHDAAYGRREARGRAAARPPTWTWGGAGAGRL